MCCTDRNCIVVGIATLHETSHTPTHTRNHIFLSVMAVRAKISFNPETLSVLVKGGRFVSAREYVTMLLSAGSARVRDSIADWMSHNLATLPMSVGLVRTIVSSMSVLDVAVMDPMPGYRCNVEAGMLRVPGARFSYLDAFISKAMEQDATPYLDAMLTRLREMLYLQIIAQLCSCGDTDTARLVTATHGKVDLSSLAKHVARFYGTRRSEIMARAADAHLIQVPPGQDEYDGRSGLSGLSGPSGPSCSRLSETCRAERKLESIARKVSETVG